MASSARRRGMCAPATEPPSSMLQLSINGGSHRRCSSCCWSQRSTSGQYIYPKPHTTSSVIPSSVSPLGTAEGEYFCPQRRGPTLRTGLPAGSGQLEVFLLSHLLSLSAPSSHRLTLLYDTVLFLSREALRKAGLSQTTSHTEWSHTSNLMWCW